MSIDLQSSSTPARQELNLPSEMPPPKKAKDDPYNGSKTKECLQTKTPELIADGVSMVISTAKGGWLGALAAAIRPVKSIAECIVDGFKAKDNR